MYTRILYTKGIFQKLGSVFKYYITQVVISLYEFLKNKGVNLLGKYSTSNCSD